MNSTIKSLTLGFFLFFSISSFTWAQTVELKGVIMDSTTNQPVEFAAVGLWLNNKPIDGGLTDLQGQFSFKNVSKTATYKLVISYIGYKPMTVSNLKYAGNAPVWNVGNIKLTGEAQMLQEVTVTGQAALIEDRIDKMVYNADKDLTNRGGSAEDVLRKVPMLSVDLDGNVSLRGSENVRVLIDGKPSSIFAASIADALQQIPSDQIKSVEVITSPGAKYDAEGTAGIINIITKKNRLSGVTGFVSMGVGYLGSFGNGNLNLRDKKWGISLNGGGRFSYNVRNDGFTARESRVGDIPTYLIQLDDNRSTRNNGNYQGTFDYDINDKNNFSIGFRINQGGNSSIGSQTTELQDANRVIVNQFVRDVDQTRQNLTYNFDLTYTKKYDKPDQELSVLGQISRNNRNENFDALRNGLPFEMSRNSGLDQEITLQVDYVQPWNKNRLDLGAKAILRDVTSDGTFSIYNANTQTFIPNPARANFLDYNQDVLALYSSLTFELPNKWGLQAGGRLERTIIGADFKDVSNADIPDYTSFLPSVNVSKALGKSHKFRLSYTQRIERPSIRFLNPFVNLTNPTDISFGNPVLSPELVDQFELNYSTFYKANSITVSLFNRSTDNSITSVRSIERIGNQDITQTTFDNIGINRSTGVNISTSLQPTKNFRLGAGVNAFYVYLDNRLISNEGWNYNYNANASYTFGGGWAAQFFGFYRTPRVELQGLQGAFNFHTVSFKKDLKNKKGSFGLGLENPFAKAIVIKSNFEDATNPNFSFTQENVRNIYRRAIRVDFQYRFGKMDATGNAGLFRKRKSIQNDDLKSGGDGGEEGGGAPSGGPGGRRG